MRTRVSLVAMLLAIPSFAVAQRIAPDGVTLNDEGVPQYSTFSLCAIDPSNGQSGAAVTTRVPFVGRAVPHVRAGVGAVCTQASTMVQYGRAPCAIVLVDASPPAYAAETGVQAASQSRTGAGPKRLRPQPGAASAGR